MTILGQTTYPGFGYEISRGATTPWEQWTYESNMETHDHAMFAGVTASLCTQFGGIARVRLDRDRSAGSRGAGAPVRVARHRAR